ncbi:MAG TPA: indole-3-glycerol phosphate synthase TrpC [Bacillales bacterium]|nr:indole-3-glycerol phosphate synthase TrpC [Bacillales bacterium]
MLKEILKVKQQEVRELVMPPAATAASISFLHSLKHPNRDLGLIAEVKKASPSRGVIRADFDPVDIASRYEDAGADAISVLTDETFFQGYRDYIPAIKERVKLPVLRKDFIIDEKQVTESKLIGADAILLIAAVLDAGTLHDLYVQARELELDCLVEVHSEAELHRVLERFTPEIIGVNNRDLARFTTSLDTTEKLSSFMPENTLFISESGIFNRSDLDRVKRCGAQAVLVGEALMKSKDPGAAVRSLFDGGEFVDAAAR